MVEFPSIETDRLQLSIFQPQHAEDLLAYYRRNRAFLEPWEPTRDESSYCIDHFVQMAEHSRKQCQEGTGYRFVAFLKSKDVLVACCNASNVVRGVFQACHLGFSIDESYQGRGLMTEAVRSVLAYLENELGLHRVMANHLPNNERSAKLLSNLGFEQEGYAKSYLKIAGRWQDHVLRSVVFCESE